jgi:hypothetical protein
MIMSVKYLKTNNALTVFLKTGPKVIPSSSLLFRSIEFHCREDANEDVIAMLLGDYSYDSDDVSLEALASDNRLEAFFEGSYHDVPARIVQLVMENVAYSSLTKYGFAQFLYNCFRSSVGINEISNVLFNPKRAGTWITQNGTIAMLVASRNEVIGDIERHIVIHTDEPVQRSNKIKLIEINPAEIEVMPDGSWAVPRYRVLSQTFSIAHSYPKSGILNTNWDFVALLSMLRAYDNDGKSARLVNYREFMKKDFKSVGIIKEVEEEFMRHLSFIEDKEFISSDNHHYLDAESVLFR